MRKDISNEEIQKQIYKYNKKCASFGKAVYVCVATLGLTLASLVAGLVGGFPLLKTIGTIGVGASIVGQLGFLSLSYFNNSKSIDLQEELERRESIAKEAKMIIYECNEKEDIATVNKSREKENNHNKNIGNELNSDLEL